jgi:NADPH2:quinone reductase
MKTLYITHHANAAIAINLQLIDQIKPNIKKNECLIKVISSGINPSDALAAMGYFNHAVLPRVPGRDFAGIVIEGPGHLMGKKVWGTGGAAGIASDGTQSEYIKLQIDEISEIPSNLNIVIAGAQPLPYVTAYYSLVKRAHLQKSETVLVVGALGQVGSAAMSICEWTKCPAIALVRGTQELNKAIKQGWNAINSEENNLAEKILAANKGQPLQVILNSVGNIYWQEFTNILSEFGRIVTIGARENVRDAQINLFNLYRANQDLIGINTVSLNFSENAKLLDELKIGFEENQLKPLTVDPSMIYSLNNANEAYKEVLQGSSGKRVVIQFTKEETIS